MSGVRYSRGAPPSLILLVLSAALLATAQARAEPALELPAVLRSLAHHYPVVLAERATLEAARAEARAARGEFDTTLSVQARAAPAGYYDPRRVDVTLEQPTPLLGASVYAGYRIGRGKIAPYYGEQRTLDRGELRGGVRMPLLQDRGVDARRAGVRATDAQATAAQESYRELLLDLERAAAQAYFGWVAAGQKQRVQEELVALAEKRALQIDELVLHGALPEIEALDNQRTILDRRQKLVSAKRSLEKAAIDLSLYLRTEDGEPQVAGQTQLPLELEPAEAHERPPLAQAEQRALADRPELAAYDAQLRAAGVDRELARTRVAPRLDAFAEVSRDYGDADAATEAALRPTVVEVGATFSMPLWLRKARGKLDAAEAKLRALREKANLAADKVRAEVRDAHSQHGAATERVSIAQQVVAAAARVTEGEHERLALGASTVLFVNLREQQSADAQIALIDAMTEAQYALVRMQTVEGISSLLTE